MLRALALILTLQLAGEAIVEATGAPVPGPVLGLAGLLAILFAAGGPSEPMRRVAGGFLDHLGLLFVPAGVGVTLHLGAAAADWAALSAAILVATPLAILATAALFTRLAPSIDQHREADGGR